MAYVPSDLAGYADQASSLTGLSTKVILAQWIAENGWATPKSYNFGNIMVPGTQTTVKYSSGVEGAIGYADFLKNNSNYAGVLATVGQSDQAQMAAIVASPWDAGHYANGLLTAVYNSIEGISAGTGSGGSGGDSGGGSGGGSSKIKTSDSTSLKLFFTVLGGAMVILGLKILTDVPIQIGGLDGGS